MSISLRNIQGDLIYGLPKKHQIFLFFQIRKVDAFRQRFGQNILPHITTTAQVVADKKKCREHKRHGHHDLLPIRGLNVAFSVHGLRKLGITDTIDFKNAPGRGSGGDAINEPGPFEQGQLADAFNLGDPGRIGPTGFDPAWKDDYKAKIHGVFLITGETWKSVETRADEIGRAFAIADGINAAIVEVTRLRGQARPGDENGHEHFGFKDGISQPAVKGFHPEPPPGTKVPAAVEPGVILVGREGDHAQDLRPDWTIDGSFLAFRQLDQLVPEFDQFLEDQKFTEQQFPDLSPLQRKELLGARMVGRWKSGTPVDLKPLVDDDPSLSDSNDFDFAVTPPEPPQTRCPFFAHIRKTMPRSDLGNNVSRFRIMRHGIPYGPEVTPEEIAEKKTLYSRGLAFVSYQSHLVDGFRFLQQGWANNTNFPPKGDHETGVDPIIGQKVPPFDPSFIPENPLIDDRESFGKVPGRENSRLDMPFEFTITRGGEYFFSPSLTALASDKFSSGLTADQEVIG